MLVILGRSFEVLPTTSIVIREQRLDGRFGVVFRCNVGLRLQGFGVFGIGTLQFRFRESLKERSIIPCAHRRVDVTEEAQDDGIGRSVPG